jgi:hypothetical protein
MEVGMVEVNVKGNYVPVRSLKIGQNELVIMGTIVKTAMLRQEWYSDLHDPVEVVEVLKNGNTNVDLLTFWERFPEGEPKYKFHTEWEETSVMRVETFIQWWKHQLNPKVRTKIRKAEKKGLLVRKAFFDDELVRGISEIFNETPIRQRNRFWHYGKSLESVKKDMGRDLDRSEFLGAYYEGKLVGFIKLLYGDKFADPVECLSMLEHSDKAPNNALIARAVAICEEKGLKFLTYGPWRRGTHAQFLQSNGFEKMIFHRYYVPISLKGKIVLKYRLHRGLLPLLPEWAINRLRDLRSWMYMKKFSP